MPIQAQKIMFLGSLLFIIDTPKRHFLAQKHAFWALIGLDRSYGVIWARREEYKKKEPKVSQSLPFSQTPFPSSHINHILHAGSYPRYCSWFWVSKKSVEKCGSSGGRIFLLSYWLGTSLIQQLNVTCYSIPAMDANRGLHFFRIRTQTQTVVTQTRIERTGLIGLLIITCNCWPA